MNERYVSELEEVIEPYRKDWSDWTASDFCFLTKTEIKTVEQLLSAGSVEVTARRLNKSSSLIRLRLQRIIVKLRSSLHKFHEWQSNFHEGNNLDSAFPLDVPINCLDLSPRVKHLLLVIGDTLREILGKWNGGDLKNLRGFGKAAMNELQAFLSKNGYSLEELYKIIAQKNETGNSGGNGNTNELSSNKREAC